MMQKPVVNCGVCACVLVQRADVIRTTQMVQAFDIRRLHCGVMKLFEHEGRPLCTLIHHAVAVVFFKEFIGIAIVQGRRAGLPFFQGVTVWRARDIVVHLGDVVADLVLFQKAYWMATCVLKLRQDSTVGLQHSVRGFGPGASFQVMGEMRAGAGEIGRRSDNRLKRAVDPQMPQPASLELPVHPAVLIDFTISGPKTFPTERDCAKIMRRRAQKLCDGVVLMQDQEFIDIARQNPISRFEQRLTLPRAVGRQLWRFIRVGLVLHVL